MPKFGKSSAGYENCTSIRRLADSRRDKLLGDAMGLKPYVAFYRPIARNRGAAQLRPDGSCAFVTSLLYAPQHDQSA